MYIDKLRGKQQKEQTKKHKNEDEIGRSTRHHKHGNTERDLDYRMTKVIKIKQKYRGVTKD